MTRRTRPNSLQLLAAIGLCLGGAAYGQQQSTGTQRLQRLQRELRELDDEFRLTFSPDQPIAERLLLEYGGTYRSGFYAIDDAFGSTRILREYDLRLYLRAELDGAHRFFGRLRFLWEDWNSGDSFDGRGDEFENPIGDRYWYQFDLRGAVQAAGGERLGYNVNVKTGKQFVEWGTGLTLSNALYAVLVDAEAFDLGFIGLAGITPSSDTVDFDGSRPAFDTSTSRAFVGGAVEYRGWSSHRPYAYYLTQRDNNDEDFAVFTGPLGSIPTRFDYDSSYVGIGARGSIRADLRYRAELVYEYGEGLSNSFDTATGLAIPQTFEDVSAWGGLAGLTYLLRDDADTRLDFQILAASGDDDRLNSANTFGGNRSGTEDTAFNALGFVDTGLALSPFPSNLLILRAGLSTFPMRGKGLERLRFGVRGYLFAKLDEDAPLNVGTVDETFVGGEVDLFLDWRIASDLSGNLRYGVFFPGDAMAPGQDDVRHFFYAGFNYAF